MAVGIWTLALKSDYISLLASGTYLATAYILVVAGVVVMVTGALGCCATFKERRNLLRLVSGAGRTAGGGGAPCQAAWEARRPCDEFYLGGLSSPPWPPTATSGCEDTINGEWDLFFCTFKEYLLSTTTFYVGCEGS